MMASEYTQIVMKTPVEHVGTLSEFKNNVNAPKTESSGFEDTFKNLGKPNNSKSSTKDSAIIKLA